MDGAEPDVLASMSFPKYHRVKIHSTNPIERVNGEIKRRTEVVGIFPKEAAIVRLADAIPSAERRAGGPARPLHDAVHHRAVARRSPRQPACRGA
jgi:transposase-like protein